MNDKFLQVRVISPRGDVFKSEARAVSSKNSAGKFDVLPEHANFVTLIDNETIDVVKANGKKEKLRYPIAILHAYSNNVNIYTDIQAVQVNEVV